MWTYHGKLFDNVIQEFQAFVYIIERINLLEDDTSPIYYVGKKSFFSSSKHKNSRIKSESDWWDYYGSSDWLNQDIARYGNISFKRTILHLCRTNGDAGYLEALEHMKRDVLGTTSTGRKLYYNKNILGRYHTSPDIYTTDFDVDAVVSNECNIGITNGVENRFCSLTKERELLNTSSWISGRCEKEINVNDGKDNFTIFKSQLTPSHNIGWLSTYVTIGETIKLIPNQCVTDFIANNPLWCVYNGDMSTTIDKHSTVVKTPKLRTERIVWDDKPGEEIPKLLYANNGVNQLGFSSETHRNNFIIINPNYKIGLICNKLSSSTRVWDFVLNEKVIGTDASETCVKLSTRLVKIKKKNRIMFEGYLKEFCFYNKQYSYNYLLSCIKKGVVHVASGKNSKHNDEKLTIKWK